MYAWVRHPIYTLSMILMVCSFLVVPTLPMGVTMAAHLFLLTLKVRSEEESLIALHGQVYVSYCQRTGRFLPRLIGPARG
jgi:protein-S-isoprenylcysteine O-methyltransferase Ste14